MNILTHRTASFDAASKAIGVFDSGIGGLTVIREIKKLLPDERLIYFGDTARVPYGSKSRMTVKQYSRENTQLLRHYDVKMVVVACNTSSSVALDEVREEFSGPVVDVVGPGVKAAVEATRNNRIGIIATKSTIGSRSYQNGIEQLRPEAITFPQACPLLVPLAEEGWEQSQAARLIVTEYLKPLIQEDIDTLVMGCTHYPLLEGVLKEVAGPDVRLVSSATETAREVSASLERYNLASPLKGRPDLFLSSDSIDSFREFYTRIVGPSVDVEFAQTPPQ